MSNNDEDNYEKQRKAAFEAARSRFSSAASTLPKGYLKDNAERLLLVALELMQTYRAELRLARLVEDVDVASPHQVFTLAREMERYMQEQLFDQDRSHCHNIGLLAAEMRKPYQGGSEEDARQLKAFDGELSILSDADTDFLFELENLARDARDTAVAMRQALPKDIATSPISEQVQQARNIQEAFARASDARIAKARAALGTLSELSYKLIRIAGGEKVELQAHGG